MAFEGSPAVARHRLRLALRRAREAKDLTQGQVATSLDWSLSKLQRIEGGENSVSPTDTRALLQVLGVTDATTVDDLVNEARAARRRSKWDDARYRETLSDATRNLLQFEGEARAIRAFQSILLPGALQTRAFAEHVLSFWHHEFTPEDLELRVNLRAERRARLFDRPDPPEYRLLLDESVLHRPVGGPAVFVRQLEQLLDDCSTDRITLRIAPFEVTALFAIAVPFTVLTLDDGSDSVLYRESYLVDEFIHDPEKVNRHLELFEQLWDQSHDRQETQRLIALQIDRLKSGSGGAQLRDES
jgi:transcriptional regulator with XRE-family HTH domain